jgi:hypothetical protein
MQKSFRYQAEGFFMLPRSLPEEEQGVWGRKYKRQVQLCKIKELTGDTELA